jgi:hypothetical protein
MADSPRYGLMEYDVPVQVGLTDEERPQPVMEQRHHVRVICESCHWSTVLVEGVDDRTVAQVQDSHDAHHEAMTPEAWAVFNRQKAVALSEAQRGRRG